MGGSSWGKLQDSFFWPAEDGVFREIRPDFVAVRSPNYDGYWFVHREWKKDLQVENLGPVGYWWEGSRYAVGPVREEMVCRVNYVVNDLFFDIWDVETYWGFSAFQHIPLPGKLSEWSESSLCGVRPSITRYSFDDYDKPPYPTDNVDDLIYEGGLLLQPEVEWISESETELKSPRVALAKEYFGDSLFDNIGYLESFHWNSHRYGSLVTSEDRNFEYGSFNIIDFSPDIIYSNVEKIQVNPNWELVTGRFSVI